MRPNRGIIGAISDTYGVDVVGRQNIRKYGSIIGGYQDGLLPDSDERFALRERGPYRLYDGYYAPKNVVRDDVFYQTSLLINANASRTFIDDASQYKHDITINGDTEPSSFNPYDKYPLSYSAYFDGSGDYLTIPTDSSLNLQAEDFTIEFWLRPSVLPSNYKRVFSISYTSVTQQAHEGIIFEISNTNVFSASINGSNQVYYGIAASSVIVANQWEHWAFVRNGSTLTLYRNGVSQGTASPGTNTVNYASTFVGIVGRWGTSTARDYNGYIADLRVVKGTAIYTSNFTPPTAPLTAISGTSLLTCQRSAIIDVNTELTPKTISVTNAVISTLNPYSDTETVIPQPTINGSGYFDGTGDYLSIADDPSFDFGTDPFTFEAWIYLTANNDAVLVDARSLGSNGFLISPRSDGTIEFDVAGNNILNGTIVRPLNTWAHVVICKDSSNNISLFINGKRDVTTTSTASVDAATNIYIGSKSLGSSGLVAITGYISNLRFIKGTAIYDPTQTTITVPTSPLTAVADTSLLTLQNRYGTRNNHATDSSNERNLIRLVNEASAGSFSPFSTRSWALAVGPGGSGTYRYINGNGAVNVGSEDFTWECWFLREGIKSFDTLISQAAAGSVIMRISSSVFGGAPSPNTIISNASVTAGNGQWVHMAYSRENGQIYSHINGYPGTPASSTGGYSWTGGNMRVGNYNNNSNQEWPGYIASIRVVKGRAIYAPNTQYDLPVEPFLPVEGTTFLCYQDPYEMDTSVTNEHSYVGSGTPVTVPIQKLFNNLPPRTPLGYSVGFRGGTTYARTDDSTMESIIGTSSLSTSTTMTIEGWVHIGAYAASDYGYFVGDMTGTSATNYWGFGANTTGYPNLYWYDGAGKRCTGDINIPLWTWTHVAVVVDNSDIKLFVNGNLCNNSGTTTLTNTTSSLGYLTLGGYNNSGLCGGLHDLRISNVAKYSSSFTAPTATIGMDGDTTFYIDGSTDQVTDASSNGLNVTSVGYRTGPSEQNPWGWAERSSSLPVEYDPAIHGGSMGLDGTTDYASVKMEDPDLPGDFTIEFCVYLLAGGSPIFYDGRGADTQYAPAVYLNNNVWAYYVNGADRISSTDVPVTLNKWYHVAVSRKNGIHKMFINGRQVGGTWSDSTAMTHGAGGNGSFIIGSRYNGVSNVNGYMAGIRVVKGTSLYNGNFLPPRTPPQNISGTTLLLNFDDVPIQDETGKSVLMAPSAVDMKSLESVGTGRRGRGMYFNGAQYLYLKQPYNTQNYPLNLDTNDFTVECWFYSITNNADRYIFDARSSDQTSGYALILAANGTIDWYNSSVERYFGSYSANTWHHVAVTRESGTVRMYLDGVLESTAAGDTVYHNSGSTPSIGQYYGGTTRFYGYIDDLRIVRGSAKYTQDSFIPPTRTYLLR